MKNNIFLSIIIPCFNEKQTIQKVIKEILSLNLEVSFEIIIIDDSSNDGSKELIKKIKNSRIRKFYLDKNMGKGYAIRKGFTEAKGEYILIQDADLEYNPCDYERLIEPVIKYNAEVVYGSRFTSSQPRRVLYFYHYIANKLITLTSNFFTNLNLSDIETGYKLIKKELLNNIVLKENRFGIEPELTAKLSKQNCVIYEVGIGYNGRKYSDGKKIGLKDAFRAFYCIIKYNLFE